MFAVATALAVVGLLLVALLTVPVVLVIDAERSNSLKTSGRLRWLFGLVEVRLSGRRQGHDAVRRAESARPAPKRRPSGRRARMGLAVLRSPGLVRRVVQLARDLRRQIKVGEFTLHTEFGFESPADTGVTYGLIAPWLVMARRNGLNVDCRPMFLQPGLRGTLHGSIQVRPLTIAGVLAAFFVSPSVVRAMRSAWQARI